jgi:NAD(P)-dependent dehydrogenase (short-subunit alcohol dehydrogenase family)
LPFLPDSFAHGRSTPLLQDWLGDDAAKRHRREIHFPTGRFGEAIEQAQAILFLASDESSFVNGADFVVDGGMTKVRSRPTRGRSGKSFRLTI